MNYSSPSIGVDLSQAEQLDVAGLRQLEMLAERTIAGSQFKDSAVLRRMPNLHSLRVVALDIGAVWGHPSLEIIDVRGGLVKGWPPPARGLFPALRRLVLVDATGPAKAALARDLSPPLVLHSALDELRAILSCLSMVAVRWRTRETFTSQDSRVASAELASILRSILASASTRQGNDMGEVEIDLYDGTSVLTVSPSADCKRLHSWNWENGRSALALPDEAAQRLCAWLVDLGVPNATASSGF